MYYVYIAKCSDNTYYTGYCSNLKERENTHNQGEGSKYTRARLPLKFIYSEKFKSRSAAMKREHEIKKLSRLKKTNLINNK